MEVIAKTLFLYGPFALLAFLVFVMQAKARKQLSDPAPAAVIRVSIFVAVWLSIFICAAICVWVWMRLNMPPEELIIRGRLTGLQESDDLRSRSKEMFIRKVYDKDKEGCDFSWVILTNKRFNSSNPVDLWVDIGQATAEDPNSRTPYELPILDDFYTADTPVLLSYDRGSSSLRLRTNNGWITLQKMAALGTNDDSRSWWDMAFNFLVPTVFAQYDMQTMAARLESNDTIVRTDARTDLAKQGQGAIPFIEETLNNPKASYRQRLGVLVALNKMSGSVKLKPTANCAILAATAHPDPTMRAEAVRVLSSRTDFNISTECNGPCNWPFRKLNVHGIQDLAAAPQPVYVYLAGVSVSEEADVYLISSTNKTWSARDRNGKLANSAFKSGIAALKPAEGQLSAETYIRRKLKKGESFETFVPGFSNLRIAVKETHYSKDSACLIALQK